MRFLPFLYRTVWYRVGSGSQGISVGQPKKSISSEANVAARSHEDARWRAFLTGAADLFLEQGFDAVSIDAIIGRVGGSKTSIYRFFGGKEGLLKALIVDECDRLTLPLRSVTEIVESAESLFSALKFIGHAYLDILSNSRSVALYRLVIAQSPRFPQLSRIFVAAGPETATQLIADAFDILRKRSFLGPNIDPLNGARRFMSTLRADIQLKLLLGGEAPNPAMQAAFVKDACEAFIRIVDQNRELSPGVTIPRVKRAETTAGPGDAGSNADRLKVSTDADGSEAEKSARFVRSGEKTLEASVEALYGAADGSPPVDVPFEVSVGYQIRATHRALQRNLQGRIEPHGVTLGMWYFLRVLWQSDGLSQRELSRRIGTMEPTTLSAISAMEARGLVRRERDKQDRRRQHVLLTPRGKALRADLLAVAAKTVSEATAGLSLNDVAKLLRFLDAIQANLRASAAGVEDE